MAAEVHATEDATAVIATDVVAIATADVGEDATMVMVVSDSIMDADAETVAVETVEYMTLDSMGIVDADVLLLIFHTQFLTP